jgi:hypothetical protein
MSRPMIYIALIAICVVLASWWLMFYRQFQMNEGFGIYLVDHDELVISDSDIIFYNGSSHEIRLTEAGAQKMEKLGVRVPLNGTRFVMKIKGKDVYDGWFWSPISSLPCPGIVIETLVRNSTIQIEAGYPSSYFQGEDPRSNPEVFSYFQSIGKLVD